MGLNHKCKTTKCAHMMGWLIILELQRAEWLRFDLPRPKL